MTDSSGPFDGESSGWAEAEWFRHMPAVMPSGVIQDFAAGSPTLGPLAFASSGLAVTIQIGNANVGGAGFERFGTPSATTVPANTHSTWSRRDRIVARRSLGTHDVTIAHIQGTAAASPTAPAITQDATTFDLKLFSFLVPPASGTTISGVVDERVWVDPKALPRTVQIGTVAASFSAANQDTGFVSFPTAFATAPVVQLTPQVPSGSIVDLTATLVGAPSTTGFSWRLRERGGTNITLSATLNWQAMT